ncbi:uncharacterized protein J3D65DRAFT_691981 [Phyllosticta citribraziliensis]|uniref:Uncharacterized protein n=1 Tax=Phyllosticta citribraziliensis TaxID=989973 RepID=A0ABR1M1P0_9PEZI
MTPRNIPTKIAYADWLAKSTAQSPTSSDPASPTPPTPTTPRRRGARAGRNQRYQPFDYTAVETPPPEVPSQSTEPQPSHESSANEGVPLNDEQKIAAEGDDQNQRLASNSREVTPESQGSIQPTLTSPSQTTAVDPDLTSSQEQPPQTPAVDHNPFPSQEQPLQTTAVDPDLTSSQEQPPQTPAVDPDLFSSKGQLPQTTAVDYDRTASQEQPQADSLHQQSPVTPVKSTYSQAAQKNLPLRQKDPVTHTHSQAAQQTPRRRPSAIHTPSQAAQQRHHRRTSADYTQGQPARAAHQGHHRRTSADFIPGQAAHQSHQRRTFADYTRGQPARAAHQGHHRRTSADYIQGQAAYQDHHRRTSADYTRGHAALATHRTHQRRTSANYDYEQGFQQIAYQQANLNSTQASTQGQQQHTIPQANLHEHPHPQATRYHPAFLPDLPQPLEFPTPEAHTYSELYGGYFSKQDLRYIHHVYDNLSQQAFFALHNMPFNEPPSSSVPSSAMPSSAAPSSFNDAASSTSNESMDKYAWARGMVARERARERAEQEEERMQAEATQFTPSLSTPHAYGSQLHSRQTSGTSYHSGPQQARPAFGPHPGFTTQHGTPHGTPTTAAAMPSMASTSGNITPTATPTKPKMIHLAPDVPVSNDSWPVFRLALAARLQLLQKEAQEYEDRVRRNAALEKQQQQQQQAAGARGGHARKGSWLKEKGGAMHRVEDQTFGGLPFGTTGEQQEQQQQRKGSADDSIAASMAQLTLADIAAGKVDISKRQLMAFSDEELFGSFGFKEPGPEQVQDLFNRYQALLLAPAAAAAPAAAPVLPGPGLGFGVATPAAAVVVPAAGAADQHFLADTYSAHGGPRLPAEHVSRALRAGGPFVPAPGAPGPAPRPVVKSSAEAKPAVSAVAPARKKETFVPGVSGACFGTFDRSVWNGSQLPRELRRGGEEKKGEEGKEKEKKKEEMGFLPGLGFDQV